MKTQIKESELLPSHYVKAEEPFYTGDGNHSVLQLEKLCNQYKEYAHQLKIREQTLLQKLNAVVVKECTVSKRAHMYSRILNQPYPRKCLICGEIEDINDYKISDGGNKA